MNTRVEEALALLDAEVAGCGRLEPADCDNCARIKKARTALAALRAQPAGGGCDWQQQDRGGDWVSTACGNEFVLNDASQYKEGEQVFPHCPYCAKPATFHNWEASK